MTYNKILLDHGSGGKISHQLTTELLLPLFDNPMLATLHDGAVFEFGGNRFAFSTDTFTVDPIFFPGGDIGDLAVNGTVNDLCMCGATPLFLSLGLIIEEGLPMDDLQKILQSISRAAQTAGVQVITGDTKVVPKGAADKIFINTTGIGWIPGHVNVSSPNAQPGDKVILSGSIAEHGIAVLTQREGIQFDTNITSDTASLHMLVKRMLMTTREIHVLRDPTRGGVGTALNEIAGQSQVGIKIDEERIPVKKEVAGVCELLGFDPLYLANEGKLIAIVKGNEADKLLSAMQALKHGKEAAIIGEVVSDHAGQVYMRTRIGGERIVDMLTGEQLPRIC